MPAETSTQTSDQAPPERRWIDEVEHPAAHTRARRVPAGQAIATVFLALAVAWLLNSESVLRKGEGMDPGVTRTVVLALARPVNSFAHTVGLAAPRSALDAALGHQSYVAANTALENGSDAILDTPQAGPLGRAPRREPARPPAGPRPCTRKTWVASPRSTHRRRAIRSRCSSPVTHCRRTRATSWRTWPVRGCT